MEKKVITAMKHFTFYQCACFMYMLIKLICFTGANRWYGIVEFDNKSLEQLQSIQSELDWRDINGIKVHCDFISPKLTCYSELNSKCLLVDNLPLDYCDISGFREIFSCHARPLYCSVSKKVSLEMYKSNVTTFVFCWLRYSNIIIMLPPLSKAISCVGITV